MLSALLSTLLTGCSYGSSYTIVEKRVRPSHFKFVPVVDKQEPGAGGWRAACLFFHLAHDDGRAFICKVGVEVPMETAATPLGPACTSFITAYTGIFERAAKGGRITRSCRPEAEAAQ